MDASSVAVNLKTWANEFSSISGENFVCPGKLWEFLARRLVEAGFAEEDPDVVEIRTMSGPRRIRVTGTAPGSMLTYLSADGSLGQGMCKVDDVREQDRGRLTTILESIQPSHSSGIANWPGFKDLGARHNG